MLVIWRSYSKITRSDWCVQPSLNLKEKSTNWASVWEEKDIKIKLKN